MSTMTFTTYSIERYSNFSHYMQITLYGGRVGENTNSSIGTLIQGCGRDFESPEYLLDGLEPATLELGV